MVEEVKIQDWCWLNARVIRKFNYLVNQCCENLAKKSCWEYIMEEIDVKQKVIR